MSELLLDPVHERLRRGAAVRALMAAITAAGGRLYRTDSGFAFTPSGAFQAAWREPLREYKPEILAWLDRQGNGGDAPRFGRVHRDGVLVRVEAPASEDLAEALKPLAGRFARGGAPGLLRWSGRLVLLIVPELLELAADFLLEVDEDVLALCQELVEAGRRRLADSQATTSEEDVPGLARTLRPFQRAGVRYLLAGERVLVGDDMGLGKTVTSLAYLEATASYPAVIVCPASLKLNWAKEALGWLPRRRVSVLDTAAKKPLPVLVDGKRRLVAVNDTAAEIVIVNYEILKKWAPRLQERNPRCLVVDESHNVKNHQAQRTKLCKQLAEGVPRRLLLSGTPILNNPADLISQLDILGRLDEFGGLFGFARRFTESYKDRFGWHFQGAKNLDALNRILRATCYLRRTKSQVLTDLPPKQRVYLPITITNAREYAQAEEDICAWLAEQAAREEAFRQYLDTLAPEAREAAEAEYRAQVETRSRQAEQLVRFEALKQLAVKGKMAAFQEWMESFLATGQKLILFAHHVDVVNGVAARYDAPAITGQTPAEDRQAAVDRFQTDPACRLIVLNLQAGGVGLTLTAASHVAFLEFGWTPALMDQAEDRAHRMGQRDSVTAYYFVAGGTVDEEILALIERKRVTMEAGADGVRGAGESVLAELAERMLASRRSLEGTKRSAS